MFFIITTTFLLAWVDGAPNSCPDVKPMGNFDFKRYAHGRWFETGRYDSFATEKGGVCGSCVYSDDGVDGNDLIHNVKCMDVNSKGVASTLSWTVSPAPSAGDRGQLLYSYYKKVGENVTVNVLDTDYDNYAIFYFCSIDQAKKVPIELAWVKSRTPTMKPEVRAVVDKFLIEHPSIQEGRMVWDFFTSEDCLKLIS